MPEVIFKIDIEKDAKNYFDAANNSNTYGKDFTKYLRPDILEKLKGKTWDEVKDYMINFLERGYAKEGRKYEEKLEKIKKSWKKIEENYFERLENITKHKIYTDKFICYITTTVKCPYFKKENAFMISILNSVENILKTIAHEIMHLQFHYYFEDDLRKKISYEKFHDLKEALTVLLNIEFKDLQIGEDKGYLQHKKFREFITSEWEKRKDFEILLDKCIGFLNN